MPDHSDHDHSDSTFDGFSIDEIKENFSALAQEIENDESLSIGDVLDAIDESELELSNSSSKPFYRGYTPSIKDYLERASTTEQCQEIIDYCLKQGEITKEEAATLNQRLERGGPRAFGTRQPGHYDQKL